MKVNRGMTTRSNPVDGASDPVSNVEDLAPEVMRLMGVSVSRYPKKEAKKEHEKPKLLQPAIPIAAAKNPASRSFSPVESDTEVKEVVEEGGCGASGSEMFPPARASLSVVDGGGPFEEISLDNSAANSILGHRVVAENDPRVMNGLRKLLLNSNSTIEELAAELSKRDSEFLALQIQYNQQIQASSDFRADADAKAREAIALKSDKEILDSKIKRLESKISARDDTIHEMDCIIKDKDELYRKLQKEYKDFESETKQTVKRSVDEMNSAMAAARVDTDRAAILELRLADYERINQELSKELQVLACAYEVMQNDNRRLSHIEQEIGSMLPEGMEDWKEYETKLEKIKGKLVQFLTRTIQRKILRSFFNALMKMRPVHSKFVEKTTTSFARNKRTVWAFKAFTLLCRLTCSVKRKLKERGFKALKQFVLNETRVAHMTVHMEIYSEKRVFYAWSRYASREKNRNICSKTRVSATQMKMGSASKRRFFHAYKRYVYEQTSRRNLILSSREKTIPFSKTIKGFYFNVWHSAVFYKQDPPSDPFKEFCFNVWHSAVFTKQGPPSDPSDSITSPSDVAGGIVRQLSFSPDANSAGVSSMAGNLSAQVVLSTPTRSRSSLGAAVGTLIMGGGVGAMGRMGGRALSGMWSIVRPARASESHTDKTLVSGSSVSPTVSSAAASPAAASPAAVSPPAAAAATTAAAAATTAAVAAPPAAAAATTAAVAAPPAAAAAPPEAAAAPPAAAEATTAAAVAPPVSTAEPCFEELARIRYEKIALQLRYQGY